MTRNGTFRWCGKPESDDLKDGTALLEITTDKGVKGLYWVYHGTHQTRIKRMDNGTVYACNLRTGYCECPDHTNRKLTCKHVAALRAALPRVSH